MEKMSKYVKAWFINADEDLRCALALHDLDALKYLRVVPYHCQQAAEKSIKGYLAHKKIKFAKSHDIAMLASLALPLSPDLEKLLGEAATLTSYAIRFRYPDAEDAEPTVEESKSAIRIAKAVFKELLALIPTENPMGF